MFFDYNDFNFNAGLILLKVRTQYFSEKFRKVFFYILIPFENIFPAIFSFEIQVPKFKENVLICVTTVVKVHDLLLTLLQIKTVFAP